MKRSVSALLISLSLLAILVSIMLPRVGAKENPLLALLNQPAPPPPNPFVKVKKASETNYTKTKVPPDDAPIADLIEFWSAQNLPETAVTFAPKPSDRVAERLTAGVNKNPAKLADLMNVLPDGKTTASFVKGHYDREGKDGVYDEAQRQAIKDWLLRNTDYYVSDLACLAEQANNQGEYVTGHEDLLALAKVDFDRAKPILDRLESAGSDKPSSVVAKWARYKNALASGSTSDIETYRDQLKAVVGDKKASPAMRDLALDALSREKDWSGRDEWYLSLFGDETLLDLKVNGQTFTGLTTMMMVSPEDKFVDKMIELLKSDNKAIRSAAARNLALRMGENLEIIRALLPILDAADWITGGAELRNSLIYKLNEVEMPESVPGLIKMLDEKRTIRNLTSNSSISSANSAANAMSSAANRAAVAANSSRLSDMREEVLLRSLISDSSIYRTAAVGALAKQKDSRAAPALRRILPEGEPHERGAIVAALLACNGFTVQEQLEGLETAAKGVLSEMDAEESAQGTNTVATNAWGDPDAPVNAANRVKRALSSAELRKMIGEQLVAATEISDDLAAGIVARVEQIETKDPRSASAYRKLILKWQNAAINRFLLRDLGRGIAGVDAMVRLVGQRKDLREKHSSDIADLRAGKGQGVGFGACLAEDMPAYDIILDGTDAEAKIALLACARLIRSEIAVAKAAAGLKSPNELLKIASERYLESEDSQEARALILSLHPDEVKVLGARAAFTQPGREDSASEYLYAVFSSLGNDSLYNGWYGSSDDAELAKTETRLRAEVKKNTDLAALYAYDKNYIRVYKDRAVFSWDEDAARYRERPLTKDEFENFTTYLQSQDADKLPPFITCGGEYCTGKELLMIGRKGGRRVYMTGGGEAPGRGEHAFFNGLDNYFIDLKKTPATLKYALSRDLPGLEIIFAADEFHAETVWTDGKGDIRVAGSVTAARKKVESDIEEATGEDSAAGDYAAIEKKKADLREKRRYEGYAWYRLAPGGLEPNAQQPPDVEYFPVSDGQPVQAAEGQWKARTPNFELRASDTGLFKLTAGKLTKIRGGSYSDAVLSSDGRWAFVRKAGEEGAGIIRINLATNKEFPVELEPYPERHPTAFIASLNRVLVAPADYLNGEGYYDVDSAGDEVAEDPDAGTLLLIDAATGESHPAQGEFRPLAQQTFRQLQPAGSPNEFWAALPDSEKEETLVGIYDARKFTFRQVLRVPKIKFNSMSMWADEPAAKLYFVYRGHLLALPLKR